MNIIKNIFVVPYPKSRRILVVSGNFHEFEDFCGDVMLEESSHPGRWAGTEFYYYLSENNIRGMRFDDYMLVGAYKERKDVDLNLIKSCIK
jgi:hypothetical protein